MQCLWVRNINSSKRSTALQKLGVGVVFSVFVEARAKLEQTVASEMSV